MKKIDYFFERWSDKLIWILIGTYVFIFTSLSFLKYYSFSYYDWDFASDVITLWNSVHGKWLYYPFLEQNIFGAHLYLIILLIIPIYFLFQSSLTLLFLQSLFLGLGAWPLYLLARSKLNKTFALGIALAYLLYPSLGFINLFETHFEIYEIFFLFFALYYFEKERFSRFLIFVLLAMTCKENVSLVIFMFGIYAFLRKRSMRWIATPLGMGLSWFFLAIKGIIPSFAKDAPLYQEGFIFSVYYQHLGANVFEMIKTILRHPFLVARFAFTPSKLKYIFQLFIPTGFLGFLSPGLYLITLPIFMQNLLSSGVTHSQIYYQYVALLIPFIFGSVIFAFNRLLKNKSVNTYRNYVLILFLTFVFAFGVSLGAPQLFFLRYARAYRITDLAKEKDALVRLIPKDAAVIASFQFLPRLANRHELYSIHLVSKGFRMYTSIKYEPPKNLEYALIDFNEPLMTNSFFPPEAPANIRAFLEGGDWCVLKAADDTVLFKKDYPKGPKLFEIVQNPQIQNVVNANINGQILFLGYDIVGEGEGKDRILHLVYYWKRIAEINDPLGLFLQFLDSFDQVRFVNVHTFGYRVYMPQTWPKDQVVREHHYIVIPSVVEKGTYRLMAGLFILQNGMILPVTDSEKRDFLGRIILGEVSIS